MDHPVQDSKGDKEYGHVHTQGKEIVDVIAVALASNGCRDRASLFTLKVNRICIGKIDL